MPARPFVRAVLPLSLALVALAACAEEEPTGAFGTPYVGDVSGTAMSIALGVKGDAVLVFVTDGRRTGVWLQGERSGNSLYLTSVGDARLSGRLEEGRVVGTVAMGGRSFRFEAPEVEEGGGLFRAQGARGEVTGWIVFPDGTQKGVRSSGDRTSSAPRLTMFVPAPEPE